MEFTYRPKMKELEQLALPSNLALPNVADITWSEDAATGELGKQTKVNRTKAAQVESNGLESEPNQS